MAAKIKDYRPISVLRVVFKLYDFMLLHFCTNCDPQHFYGLQNIHFGFRLAHNLLEDVRALTCTAEWAREF